MQYEVWQSERYDYAYQKLIREEKHLGNITIRYTRPYKDDIVQVGDKSYVVDTVMFRNQGRNPVISIR